MTPREQIEWIQSDASRLRESRSRLPKLVYAVAVTDHNALVASMRSASGAQPHTNEGRLWLHVGSTPVEVIGFEHWPVGHEPQRLYRCSPCGALFLDDASRSGKCGACLGSGVLVGSLTGPQRALETSFGPIPVRADPTLKPDEFRIETGSWRIDAEQRDRLQTVEWNREYLGEWKPVTDGVFSISGATAIDMASEPSRSVIATKCARCDVTFRGDSNSELNYKIKAHHEVCPGPATSCHACGLKYDSSEADVAAHRARCPGYDRFVKAMEHLAAPIRKTAPATKREWVKPLVSSEVYAWRDRLLAQQNIAALATMPDLDLMKPDVRPDGFDPESIAAIKREMLKPVAKVKR